MAVTMVEDLAYMVYEIGTYQDQAKKIMDTNGVGSKEATSFYNALEELRKDLVITTGDNYVAAAEPELRERMGELYSNVTTSYDRVSGALKQNYELIKDEFTQENKRYAKILGKEGKKFMKTLEKADIRIDMQSKEEFLKKD